MSYLGNIMINYVVRKTTPPSAPETWLALITEDGEVSGSGYSRVNVTGHFSAPTQDDMTANLSRIDFPMPTGSWGQVVGAALHDAPEGGNLLLGGAIANPITIPAATPVYWNAGQLTLSFSVSQG